MSWSGAPLATTNCDGCGEPIGAGAPNLELLIGHCLGNEDYPNRAPTFFLVHGWACAQLAMEGAKDRDGQAGGVA